MFKNKDTPIGSNIRLWRVLKGFKQTELAQAIDISRTSLSRIENDIQTPTLPCLQQIASVFKIKATDLFKSPSDFLPPHTDNF